MYGAFLRVGNNEGILVSKQGRKITWVPAKPGAASDAAAVACSDVPIDVKAVPLYYYEVYVRSKQPPAPDAHHRRGGLDCPEAAFTQLVVE